MLKINCFDNLIRLINTDWNNLEIMFAERWRSAFVVQANFRDDFEIHLLEKGKGTYTVGDRSYACVPGDIVAYYSLEGNSFTADDNMEFREIFVTFKFASTDSEIKKQTIESFKKMKLPIAVNNLVLINELLYKMSKTLALRVADNQFKLKIILSQLCLALKEEVDKTIVDNGNNMIQANTKKHVHNIIMYLQRNYNKSISLEELSFHFNLNSKYMCTLFKKATGWSIVEYLKLIKINKAKRLLTYSNLSITEISYDVGYNSSQYFNRVFKSIAGISPNKYRQVTRLKNLD